MTLLANTGYIQGGWGFVWASYGITWAFLVGYTVSLWLRGHDRPTEMP